MGIVGLGGVGREVAHTCRAMGLRVIATKRTVAGVRDDAADALWPISQLTALLEEADALVLACPLTPDTERLIGRAELAMMKPGAILINIARGAVIDEPALIEALRSGHLGGGGPGRGGQGTAASGQSAVGASECAHQAAFREHRDD